VTEELIVLLEVSLHMLMLGPWERWGGIIVQHKLQKRDSRVKEGNTIIYTDWSDGGNYPT